MSTENESEAVAAVREDAADKQAEAAEQVEEHASTWARIQGRLDDLSDTVTVVGEPVEMRPVSTDASIRALEHAEGLDETELDELEAAARGDDAAGLDELADSSDDISHLMSTVADMMDEFCVDDSMDRDKWGQLPPEFLMLAFEEWSQRELSPAEIERVNSFRGE